MVYYGHIEFVVYKLLSIIAFLPLVRFWKPNYNWTVYFEVSLPRKACRAGYAIGRVQEEEEVSGANPRLDHLSGDWWLSL